MKPDRHTSIGPGLPSWGVLLLVLPLLIAPSAGSGERLPRILDFRSGEHADFDRLVIQLERKASASWHFEGSDVVVEIEAQVGHTARALSGSRERMGRLRILSRDGAATLRAQAATRRVRAFWLSGPPRLVVDFGDPSDAPFPLAAGLVAVPQTSEPAQVAEPAEAEPEAHAVEPPRAELPPPAPPGSPIPVPPEGEALPAESEDAEALAPPSREAGPAPELPKPVPVLDLSHEPEPVQPAAEPFAHWLDRFGGVDRLWVALWFGLPFLAAAGVIWIVGHRRRGARPLRSPREGSPDPGEMSAAELLDAAERIDLLEMRIDEEVRGRMKLEERTTELQQDIKVLNDRLLRLARRDGSH